jgi:hypothetical protein
MKNDHRQPASPRGPVGTREEVGDAASSRENPPHVSDQEKEAPLQGSRQGEEIPTMPATAHGTDRVPSEDEPREVDEESAYEGRPTQDKDRPPSEEIG